MPARHPLAGPSRGTDAGSHKRDTDWRKYYESRVVEPEAIVAKVESGQRIYTVTAHECSPLVAALIGRADDLKGVEIRKLGGMWSDYGFQTAEWATKIRGNVSMASPPMRQAVNDGITEFTVTGFGDIHRHIDQQRPGASEYDFCWFTVTPPNSSGYCCVGGDLWDLRTAMRRSRVKVAGINKHLPRTFGDTWLHVGEIDYFFEHPDPPSDRTPPSPSPAAIAIAQQVSHLVKDGDTLQIGMGSTSGALAWLGTFDDKEDLGFFSELAIPGVVDLARRGVITSRYATAHPGRFVTTGLLGNPSDYAYVDENPFFEFYDYDYVLNPAVIGRNDNMVAINNALSVDLRGQISVVSIGPRIFGGSGGQLSFHMGAYLSRGGRAITVLPSTTSDGRTSRIVHQHPEGQLVTIPWDLADTIVTEYGVADLVGKSMRERAQELIAIAHPDFRSELQEALGSRS